MSRIGVRFKARQRRSHALRNAHCPCKSGKGDVPLAMEVKIDTKHLVFEIGKVL
jgi:hypothetical protein